MLSSRPRLRTSKGKVNRQRLIAPGGAKAHQKQSLWYQLCLYLVYLSVFLGACFSLFIIYTLVISPKNQTNQSINVQRGQKDINAAAAADLSFNDPIKSTNKLDPKWGKTNVNPSLRDFIAERRDRPSDYGLVLKTSLRNNNNNNGKPHSDSSSAAVAAQNQHHPRLDNPPANNAAGLSITFRVYNSVNCDEGQSDSNVFYSEVSLNENNPWFSLCDDPKFKGDAGKVKSMRIVNENNAELDLYEICKQPSEDLSSLPASNDRYHSSLFLMDGCMRIYDWPPVRGVHMVPDSLVIVQQRPQVLSLVPTNAHKLPPLQPHISAMIKSGEWNHLHSSEPGSDNPVPPYHIVYSGESSLYMAYQAQAAYYGYLTSDQAKWRSTGESGTDLDILSPNSQTKFTRLMTGKTRDDLADYVPTFQVKRFQYSKRYGPTNKADVLLKWLNSANAPSKDEIIVIIDPDNWIISDISHWVRRAKKGHALGEAAWFHGSKLVTELWKEVCEQNCDFELDLVGVPYIIHRDDLAKVAPWFRYYLLKMKEREERDKAFLKRYSSIQMGWGTEMFGYIFGAAHVGIKHEVVHGIQIRDVSSRPKSKDEEKKLDMIHMGRAWFPKEYELGKQWWHTEGRAFSHFGAQVWCKCNWTASDIIPWPMPDGTDFQSRHTLYLLHESRQYFGEIDPKSPFRRTGQSGYHWAMC